MHVREVQAQIQSLQSRGIPLSRNRAFDVYRDPINRRALKHYRDMRGLARTLRRAERLVVRVSDGERIEVHMHNRRARLTHTIFLHVDEIPFLVQLERRLEPIFASIHT
jgi:hypothetical protein